MCLIIDRQQGAELNEDVLRRAIRTNSDGWGIMLAHNGEIHTKRGMVAERFFRALPRYGASPLTIHFRWATHGTKDVQNTHPYVICGGRYAVMHNGVLNHAPEHDKNKSDTWNFAHYVLAPILTANEDSFGKPELLHTLEALAGFGNKLVILRSDGASMRVNEKAGTERPGLWYSNSHSLWEPAPISTKVHHEWSDWRNEYMDDQGWSWQSDGTATRTRANACGTDETKTPAPAPDGTDPVLPTNGEQQTAIELDRRSVPAPGKFTESRAACDGGTVRQVKRKSQSMAVEHAWWFRHPDLATMYDLRRMPLALRIRWINANLACARYLAMRFWCAELGCSWTGKRSDESV
jgi:hypothetical protein